MPYDYNPYVSSGGGYQNPFLGAVYAPAIQGMQAMSNLGNQISSGFALANLLNSANAQARYGPEAGLQAVQVQEQGRTQRLNSILPALLQAFSGSGGAGGFTTNYGASATYNSNQPQQPLTPQQQAQMHRQQNLQQRLAQQLPFAASAPSR